MIVVIKGVRTVTIIAMVAAAMEIAMVMMVSWMWCNSIGRG